MCIFISWIINRATPVGAIAMYTAIFNCLAPKTLKKCSCLVHYHFLLVRYAKMCILMAAILKNPIGPPLPVLMSFTYRNWVPLCRKPQKCGLVFYCMTVGQNCKNVFYDGGHFELSNMATPLKIGFGSRQIWVQQVKMYLCTKFYAFVQICTFIPLTNLTIAVSWPVTYFWRRPIRL